VDDNLYTNCMAAFALRYAAQAVERLSEAEPEIVENILQRLGMDREQVQGWPDIAEAYYIEQLDPTVPAQFAGFADLPEPDTQAREAGGLRDKTGTRADTLLLFQALPEAYDAETLRRCYETYAPLCNQTSSLSLCTHAMLAMRLQLAQDAHHYFETTIGIDLSDQAGNTRHGVHGAAEAGIWLAVVHGFGGLAVSPHGNVDLQPRLPGPWDRLQYRFRYRGQPLRVTVDNETVTVRNDGRKPVKLEVYGNAMTVEPGAPRKAPAGGNWLKQNLQAVIFDLDELAQHEDIAAAQKLFGQLRDSGHRVAVISAEPNAQALLKQTNLEPLIDAWVDASNITASKPDPQAFLLASQRLRCLPWLCVGVESDDVGIEAVRRAGMISVGAGPLTAPTDLTVESLADLTVEKLQKAFLESDNPINPYLELSMARTRQAESLHEAQ
jgi:predicted HAD superfamily phosphohydrolase YqeG